MKKEYARKGFLWFITSGKASNFNDAAMCPAVCKFLVGVLAVALLVCLSCQPAFAAISESDVQAQVDSAGKEAVAGNVLIWFLCAVSFLKISQKIDSFMASLGVNVGHTGGSMLAEAMIATKGLSTVRNASSRHFGGGRSSSTHTNSVRGSKSGAAGAMGGFMSGGLAGVVSRSILRQQRNQLHCNWKYRSFRLHDRRKGSPGPSILYGLCRFGGRRRAYPFFLRCGDWRRPYYRNRSFRGIPGGRCLWHVSYRPVHCSIRELYHYPDSGRGFLV